jgi:hypothetical protein
VRIPGQNRGKNEDPAVAAPADPAAELSAWFDTHIRNSRISRDTETYNRIHRAKAEIEAALANLKE